MYLLYINDKEITNISNFNESIQLNNDTHLLENNLVINLAPNLLDINKIKGFFKEDSIYLIEIKKAEDDDINIIFSTSLYSCIDTFSTGLDNDTILSTLFFVSVLS